MNPIRHNYKTDLAYVETFYKKDSSGVPVVDKIPIDVVDFELVYRAEDNRSFVAGRKKGVYFNCKPISDTSIEVAIPLSRQPLGIGDMIHELRLYAPNEDFPDCIMQSRAPSKTGLYLWKGSSDKNESIEGQMLLPILFVGCNCLLDLTTLSYPESGRKVAADVWSNIPLTISIKVAEAEPLRTVVHIETVSDQYYRLFTGDIGSVEDDGHGRLHQICYLLNRTDGTVKAEKYVSKSNIVTASALENYVRKDARLIINCGSPTDLTTKK